MMDGRLGELLGDWRVEGLMCNIIFQDNQQDNQKDNRQHNQQDNRQYNQQDNREYNQQDNQNDNQQYLNPGPQSRITSAGK